MVMEYVEKAGNLHIYGIEDFDIRQTLECGQCFHFDKIGENEYVVVYKKYMLHCKQERDCFVCFDTSRAQFESIWYDYFDFGRDYGEIKRFLRRNDDKLNEAISENEGVRILNQEFSETLMSYIISQNKQIPHIKKIVKELSEKYGDLIGTVNGVNYYAFPDVRQIAEITEEDYRECKTGFRAQYLADAGKYLQLDEYNEEVFKSLTYLEAKEKIKHIKGVGEKVANCVLLFSLGFSSAFPVDVWIKRIMENKYFGREASVQEIMQFATDKYGKYGGFAQQYLFYFAREMKVGKKLNENIKISKIEKNKEKQSKIEK